MHVNNLLYIAVFFFSYEQMMVNNASPATSASDQPQSDDDAKHLIFTRFLEMMENTMNTSINSPASLANSQPSQTSFDRLSSEFMMWLENTCSPGSLDSFLTEATSSLNCNDNVSNSMK